MQDQDAAVGTPATATAHDSSLAGAVVQTGTGLADAAVGGQAGATAAQGQAGPATATATATVGAGANGAAETGADNQTGNGQSGIVRAATATVATAGAGVVAETRARNATSITPATPYEPTAAGRKLHAIMSDPAYYGISNERLCELAGVDRTAYYRLMRDPQYATWLRSERQAAIQRHIDRVIDAGVKTAVTPGRDGYRDRELLLQMSGQYVPRSKTEVSGQLDLRPVLPAQQVDSQLQDLGLIDVETATDEPAEQ